MTFAQRLTRRPPVRRIVSSHDVSPDSYARPAPTAAAAPPNESELAWLLAGEVTASLRAADRTSVYLKLGCGDHFEALMQMLTLVHDGRLSLSKDIVRSIDRWQRGYVGSASETAVGELLKPVANQQM